jgi:phosphoglycolate phosphatase-like HAD superfamily hydrolase
MPTFVFDLDGTLCHTEKRQYAQAVPYVDRIARVNALVRAGHRVIIDTARGSGTGHDWTPLTVEQLTRWGCHYTALYVGSKTPGDVYIDDRATEAGEFFEANDGHPQH